MARRIEVEIVGDARSLEAALGKASTASGRFQRNLDPVARGAKRTLIGLGALAAGAAKLAIDFERTSSQMVGLGGVGEKQAERWKDAMLDLAPAVGKAPAELAKALYFISSSGVQASKALDVLDKSARASAAGLGDTEIVADAITSALNAYATSNLSAAEATDVLVATVREGKGEAAAIAPVLGNILPIASQLGVGFNEVGAAMASMTRLGTDASTAATNISATFTAILKPSKQAQDAFKKMGTSANELRAMMDEKGLLKTLQFLEERTKGNAAAMAKAFPNVRALRGVLQLVGQSGEATAGVFKTMEDNTGSLGTAFSATAKTDGFKLEQSFAAIKATGIRMGADVAPAVAGMAGALADAAGFAADHETATKAAAIAVAGLSTAVIGANTALKIYNSQLVAATVGKAALARAAAVAGPIGLLALAVGGAAIAIKHFTDDTGEAEEGMRKAAASARDYRAALNELRGANETYKDAQLRVEAAELAVKRARKDGRAALRENAEGSLVAREAALRLAQAERELERAEKAVGVATRETNDARTRVGIGARKAQDRILELRDAMRSERDVMGELTPAAFGGAAAFKRFNEQQNARAAAQYSAKVGALAQQLGGATTEAGRAALEVQRLTERVGRIPTKKEIRIALQSAEAWAEARRIHDHLTTPAYKPVILRPVGTTGTQRQHGGPVMAGRPYIVGERQPELFVPNTNGRILPRVPAMAAAGGGGRPVQVNVMLDRRVLASALVDFDNTHRRSNGGRGLFG